MAHKPTGNAKIKFFALGGQDERGKNCAVLEIDGSLFVFNAGALVPTASLLGVKQLIPDYTYLEQNKQRVKAIFVGYPNQENLGSLEQLLRAVGPVPIYVSPVGAAAISAVAKRMPNFPHHMLRLTPVEPLRVFEIATQRAFAFRVANSLPAAYGFVFLTSSGAVVYVDQFIVTNDKNMAFESDLNDLAVMLNNQTLLLCVGAGYVGKNTGFTAPKHKSKPYLEQIINDAPGRVFMACYDANAYAILTMAQIAKQKQRPLIVHSPTFNEVLEATIKHRVFNASGLSVLPPEQIEQTDNALVCVAANPHRLYARLSKMANGEDEQVKFRPTDTFVLVTPRVAGYEGVEADILDDIARADVDFYRLTNDVLPMHASDEDQKYLLNALRPRYVIPLAGLYKDFIAYATIARHAGLGLDQVKILYNGEAFSLAGGIPQTDSKEISLEAKYVDASGIQDVGGSVLFEREQMAENGVVIIALFFDVKKQVFCDATRTEFYGISDDDQKTESLSAKINEQVKTLAHDFLIHKKKATSKPVTFVEMHEFKTGVRKAVSKIFERTFDKKPIVLPTIVDL